MLDAPMHALTQCRNDYHGMALINFQVSGVGNGLSTDALQSARQDLLQLATGHRTPQAYELLRSCITRFGSDWPQPVRPCLATSPVGEHVIEIWGPAAPRCARPALQAPAATQRHRPCRPAPSPAVQNSAMQVLRARTSVRGTQFGGRRRSVPPLSTAAPLRAKRQPVNNRLRSL